MHRSIEAICWHDMELRSVTEDCAQDILVLHVNEDVSANSNGTEYAERTLIFHGVIKYSIDEGPVYGTPTVIEIELGEGVTKLGTTRYIVLLTTAGTRTIYYTDFVG